MPHHPFAPEDVPYMQAYSHVLLENDYQTYQLLCRLTAVDSPTFHKYGKKPPMDVLDLGCGEGFWVLHAAKLWKSYGTKVTGFDLIDLHNNEVGEVRPSMEPAYVPKNVTWKRGNFLHERPPFPDESFDLVRMANLSLCIREHEWQHVFEQVWRILRPGGRLELIEDDLFFPAITPRPTRDAAPAPTGWSTPGRRPRTASTVETSRRTPIPRSASTSRPGSPLLGSIDQDKPLPDLPWPFATPTRRRTHRRVQSDIDFALDVAQATYLENAFGAMLARQRIAPRPDAVISAALTNAFGDEWVRQTQELELSVPSRALSERCQSAGIRPPTAPAGAAPGAVPHGHGHHGRRTSEDERPKHERLAAAPIPIPPPASPSRARWSDEPHAHTPATREMAAKARKVLVDGGEIQGPTGPYQPPGLVLLPATLLPCSPLELEMHACKHMNTLLGCKNALTEYLVVKRDKEGKRCVSEKMVADFLWEYDLFRRKRFNWPQDIPDLKFLDNVDDDHDSLSQSLPPSPPPIKTSTFLKAISGPTFSNGPSPPSLPAAATSSALDLRVPCGDEQSTHVRTIRVYEALKPSGCRCGCHHSGLSKCP
ncbi:S-adenosyl-L-methionine-dependent methyltransferase [Epithele typhae]|uniref:S-adenosyl-L-methionine-dependent methyltransferase n=1 Tax=Epithele typhae TaxID=378194 RepID=UPI002007A034|nr:S-adenosyl-L-methionine-dependent methyltransferase [Epithele typhae]KAH9932002.1 S-adenosyl-L-methionine-dependent methyltransferase [Epithele typhae]